MANVENTYALTRQARIKAHLKIPTSNHDHDHELNDLNNEISAAMESYCGRRFRSRTYVHNGVSLPRMDSHGGTKLWIPNFPVTSVSSLKTYPGTTALTEWDGTSGEYIIRNEVGCIELIGQEWYDAPRVVEITYTGGFQDSPAAGTEHLYGWTTCAADLELACVKQVAWTFHGKDRLREGVESRSFEGVSTSYFSGDWLREVREVLDRYKIQPQVAA